MLRELKLKPDFGKTLDRFEAWWRGEILDRCPVTLYAPSGKPYKGPTKRHATLRDRWMDVEFQVDSAIAHLEQGVYPGDHFPQYMPNVGPELNATLLGCDLEFSENSSWSKPIIHDPAQWEQILTRPLDLGNVYWQTIEKMTDLAIEKSDGRYLVGITDIHDNYDLLAALRDPETLCLDIMDCPQTIRRVAHATANVFGEMFRRLYAKTRAAGMPCTTWIPATHDGPYYVPSCDFWCMVSDEIAREWILPDIVTEMQGLDRSIFHLDGPQALRHLDLLLGLPQLNAVQWVYGAGNGPASRWIDVYKRIVAAGKGIQMFSEDPQDAMAVLDAVGPKHMWLCTGGFDSLASAEAFLTDVERRCRRA
jgi:hypothetical protein